MEESELLRHLREGKQEYYSTLFRLHGRQVYNTCLGLLQHETDAEDVAQEVFIEVFRSVKKFRGDSKISTWLYRIAMNKCLDHIRSKKRGKRSGNVISIDGEMNVQIPVSNSFVHPGIALENKERAKILFGAISVLPENQRVAFTLNKVDGLSYQEICEVMKMKLPAVESLIHRAKQNLKRSLEEYYKS
ncbi:MAG: RNA polymerase sigma factor [Bacteroidetes bacterium]|nr:RNA polymerase sigma factor [Bacteroidota bacterium]